MKQYVINSGYPIWANQATRHYIAHVRDGIPIRALARASGVHASTVLRRIRNVETARDDPLVDTALSRLVQSHASAAQEGAPCSTKETEMSKIDLKFEMDTAVSQFSDEELRVLRRLAEPGACLAIASGVEKAVVVREGKDGRTTRTAITDRAVAEALVMRAWITQAGGVRLMRYHITEAGRKALRMALSRGDSQKTKRSRYSATDSPLAVLARRVDKTGKPFMDPRLVAVGERFRQDYEIARMDPNCPKIWDEIMARGAPRPRGALPMTSGTGAAKIRITAALSELGPGLGDVVLRACCYLEGMESIENRMGWAARSGKIVLRIALQRLYRHYQSAEGKLAPLIG